MNEDVAADAEVEFNPARKNIYTVRQVAHMFAVGEWSVRMWVKQGKLRGHKFNNRWYFTEKDISDCANRKYQ
jgi:hypothetical protein